jgi:hypothetical protein
MARIRLVKAGTQPFDQQGLEQGKDKVMAWSKLGNALTKRRLHERRWNTTSKEIGHG